jgi:GDP-mannose 6-dehydrogenase
MDIAVYGIGYVGAVVAGCMAGAGHRVVAVDVNPAKVDIINAGHCPLAEPGLPELISAAVAEKRLHATTDGSAAFDASEVMFVCVGTPGLPNHKLDLSYIIGIAEELGHRLAATKGSRRRTIVFRSTVLPGTMDTVVVPVIERTSGMKSGVDFGLGYMPEFLREGQGVDDFQKPAVVITGFNHPDTLPALREMNAGIGGRVFECDFRTAEAVKFTNNAWHATKIAFANEIGAICKGSGIDGRVIMDILCADTKLNVSRAYMRPGFAFGGSCLPKDVTALCQHAETVGVETQVLASLLPSNTTHIERAVDVIAGSGVGRVALLGLTFKPGTDDLRDSALVALAERLIEKGLELRIFDPNFAYEDITGRNRHFILSALPHVGGLLVNTLEEAVQGAEYVVVGHNSAHFGDLPNQVTPSQRILDLASGANELAAHKGYQGICW